ncbi:hypothetical protein [Chondromyces apiculatus]|nr:hypothetical protein [Chondromyces apiculatus]
MNRAPALPKAPFFGSAALALAFTTLVATPSCGGDDPAPAGPAAIPLEAFAAEYTSASCELAARCGQMPDLDTCLRLDHASGELLQLMASAVFGDVTYDADAARACVDALRNQSCDTLLAAQRSVESACAGVLTGAAAVDEPCLVAGECAGDSVCDRSGCEGNGDPCCLGKCAAAPAAVAIGGACGELPCVDEAYCEITGEVEEGVPPVGTCEARRDNGENCSASNACKDGQRCDLSTGQGRCYILSPEGEQCNATLDVACLASDNWCDPAANTCVKLPSPGQACTPNGRCIGHAYCAEGTCLARPKETEACTGNGPYCLGDLRCEMDICIPPPTPRVCVSDS